MKRPTETQEQYDERIVQFVEGKRININGIYADIPYKKKLLIFAGVPGLSVTGGGRVSVEECDNDARISGAAKDLYSDAKKRLVEYRKQHQPLAQTAPAPSVSLENSVQYLLFY